METTKQIHIGVFHGSESSSGRIVGFDYQRQVWIDTNPQASRDARYSPGSASNPLPDLSGIRA